MYNGMKAFRVVLCLIAPPLTNHLDISHTKRRTWIAYSRWKVNLLGYLRE
uniref:Uncharacterized protein n=1 Tax=Anguilla anguilla TaxID=7936 RepID=A0A0E9R1J7_ANGAN